MSERLFRFLEQVIIFPFAFLMGLTASSAAAQAETLQLPSFSTAESIHDGWEPLEFPSIDQHTRYRLTSDNGVQVVEAQTNSGASGLITRVSVVPGDSLWLRWRWKVSNVYEAGNANTKQGDDYPARLYVAFQFEPDKAGFFERAKRRAAELVFGEELPGNALNYVWANRLPKDEIRANAYTETTQMVAVQSGDDRVGEWVMEERNLVADYRRAFGTEPPPIVGIAIMTDADNTGESATAWYGDVSLLRKDPGSNP